MRAFDTSHCSQYFSHMFTFFQQVQIDGLAMC